MILFPLRDALLFLIREAGCVIFINDKGRGRRKKNCPDDPKPNDGIRGKNDWFLFYH